MFWSYFPTVYERTTLYLCCWNFTTNPAILRMLPQLHMFCQRYIRASQRDIIHMMFIRNSYSEFLWIHWSSVSPMSPVNCLSPSLGFLYSIIGVCVSGVNHILQTSTNHSYCRDKSSYRNTDIFTRWPYWLSARWWHKHGYLHCTHVCYDYTVTLVDSWYTLLSQSVIG